MSNEGSPKVRVTIWRPYFAGCMIAIGQPGAGELSVLDGDTELQREVFTWPVEEDVWAGVTDDSRRTELSTRFVTEFQPTLSPQDRNMERFAAFVSDLAPVALSPASDWSPGTSVSDETYATAFMINGLLAFYHQLSWLLDVFREMPGSSVSVR